MTFRELSEEATIALRSFERRLRVVQRETWLKVGACVAVAGLFVLGLALRPSQASAHERAARAVRVRMASIDPTRAAAPAKARESDPVAARKGDPRALKRLVAQTRADTCAARTEAAEGLAGVRNPKAIGALRKLANSSFKDESDSPGIFSCSSRRAARKALEASGS